MPAVQLFVDRAQAVRYDFELTDDNAAAVVEICRRLDGLPLAIELAAARIRLLDPAALLARLENVLDALGSGPIDLPERQRSLRATIEWSVSLLDEGERNLMAALSVFVEGWTVAAAATVAELTEDRALELLDALAGHSLVGVVATAAGPRFRMLSTVREFAAELLDADGEAGSNRTAARRTLQVPGRGGALAHGTPDRLGGPTPGRRREHPGCSAVVFRS